MSIFEKRAEKITKLAETLREEIRQLVIAGEDIDSLRAENDAAIRHLDEGFRLTLQIAFDQGVSDAKKDKP